MPAATHRHSVVSRKKRAGTRRPLKPGSHISHSYGCHNADVEKRLISGSESRDRP